MAKQNAAPGGIAGAVAPLVEPITAELSLKAVDDSFAVCELQAQSKNNKTKNSAVILFIF